MNPSCRRCSRVLSHQLRFGWRLQPRCWDGLHCKEPRAAAMHQWSNLLLAYSAASVSIRSCFFFVHNRCLSRCRVCGRQMARRRGGGGDAGVASSSRYPSDDIPPQRDSIRAAGVAARKHGSAECFCFTDRGRSCTAHRVMQSVSASWRKSGRGTPWPQRPLNAHNAH